MIWIIIQLLISGVSMGFIYALIGIEYTLIYNASGVLNFSHDKTVTLGAYVFAGSFVLGLGWNSIAAALGSLALMAVFGIAIAYLVFIPLRRQKSMIFTIMATIMLGKVMMEGACLIWGGNAFTIPDFMSGTYKIGQAVISKSNVFLIAAALLIASVLQFFLQKTKQGKAMRCVAQNRTAASIVGIDVNRNMAITIAISCVVCCCIGIMIVPLYNVNSTMSSMIGLKGFASGVLGGFGSLPGCIVGGLVLGIVENIASMILPAIYKDVVAFILLIAFLLFHPQGILGMKNE